MRAVGAAASSRLTSLAALTGPASVRGSEQLPHSQTEPLSPALKYQLLTGSYAASWVQAAE